MVAMVVVNGELSARCDNSARADRRSSQTGANTTERHHFLMRVIWPDSEPGTDGGDDAMDRSRLVRTRAARAGLG